MKVSKWKMMLNTGAFQFDREFALVDSSGLALRLSTYPRLGLIRPHVDLDRETLIVKGVGFPDLVIDLGPGSCMSPMSREIKVCGSKCGGKLWGSHAVSRWFSSFLGIQCWLARYTGGKYISSPGIRGNESLEPLKETIQERTGFENEAPILLISQNSVDLLNKVMTSQGSRRVNSMYFRPNLVVDIPLENSCTTNPEDSWSKIIIPRHNLELSMIGKCARCSMVDIDPTSGAKGGKTLRALAEYRRNKGRIDFGIFLSSDGVKKGSNHKYVSIEQGENLIIRY